MAFVDIQSQTLKELGLGHGHGFGPAVPTLLHAFLHVASSSASAERSVVECGTERWSYRELDIISSGLAKDLKDAYGPKPTVAFIAENHPYVIAIMLATWKIGGIIAPMDHHVPKDIMERMLGNIRPQCIVVPEAEIALQKNLKDLSYKCHVFSSIDSTITSLSKRFCGASGIAGLGRFEETGSLPSESDAGFYLHTSSASSVANVKCVPLTHKSMLSGSQARLRWWKQTWPQQDFTHLRVLGWSPWSHIIGLSHDLGAATFLTAGCYVFGMIPSTYPVNPLDVQNARYLDVPGQLLDAAMLREANAFAGVPWVLEGFRRALTNETDVIRKERMTGAIKQFKIFGSGGAATSPECLEWARRVGLPVVLDLGMTELGGPLFHATASGQEGWSSKDCLIPDARLLLIDESGSQSKTSEGELVIRSQLITKGYIGYEANTFQHERDGTITFRTGDIYGFTRDQRLVWLGRKEDYIQMSSGESMDPREIEAVLNQSPAIVRACVVGNNFLRSASEVVCAIIEADLSSYEPAELRVEIMKVVGLVNKELAPPLRIGWGRILVLGPGAKVPLTKKGMVFRKKLEMMFGEGMRGMLARDSAAIASQAVKPQAPAQAIKPSAGGKTKDQVGRIVASVVSMVLKVPMEILESNAGASFAELGMDSAMATKIVNGLNKELGMGLPLNTCHTHIDLVALTDAIVSDLGLTTTSIDAKPNEIRANPRPTKLEEIVIVGQAIRLPGEINTAESFWKALIDQREDIMTPTPASRWDHDSFYRAPDSKDPPGPCDITAQKAGWVELAGFDHSFFGISSAEAYHVCPNIRLTMEIAFEALENANIPISKIKGTNMGVFVAEAMDEGYIKLLFADKGWGAYTRFYGTGVATSTTCGRISYLLDIHGPSVTVDTACSSGIIALDQAVQYLQSGQGESAIVCGANTHTWPGTLGFLSAQKMTSVNSRCATFTNVADGYVPTEAATGLIVKTRSAAMRDGDKIIGVIRSTDVKHGGRSQGLVAPNVKAQIDMQIALLEKANLQPSDIDFVEAHGTGTSLGDLIEIQGINEVFKGSHTLENPLVIGAGKSCVGHAELVAGLVGVLKTLGTFADETVPGLVQLNESNMNPNLDCSVVPLHIPHQTRVLKSNKPLKGLILSNGFAGSIAGAILEAPRPDMVQPSPAAIAQNVPMMFVVSGKTQEALTQYLNDYLDFCLNAAESKFHSICYTSCVGREHYRYRFACVAYNMQDLISRLEERLGAPSRASNGAAARRVLFAFPGQGSQYQGMGRPLANEYSGFREILSNASKEAAGLTGYPVLPFLMEETMAGPRSVDESEIAQVCIFIFQYAAATWLEGLGVQAQAVMGHSLGEIAAAVIAKSLSFDQGLQFVVARARILRADPRNPACMVAIAAPEEAVERYITKLGIRDRAVVAVYNATDGHVVSGEKRAVESVLSAAKMDGLRGTKLNIDQGFHSPAIWGVLPELQSWLGNQEASPLEKAFFSTVLGKEIPKDQVLSSKYWVEHARNPVKFIQTAREVHNSSVDLIIDVGPQPTIWTNMQAPEFSSKGRIAVTGKKGKDQIASMLGALSSIFEKGLSLNFEDLYSQMHHKFSKTQLPTYPFQRIHNYPSFIANRYSLFMGPGHEEARNTSKAPARAAIANKPNKPNSTGPPAPKFNADQALVDFLDEHRIEGRRILPGAAMADFFARSSKHKSVRTIKFHKPLVLEQPDVMVRAEVDEKNGYRLVQKAVKVCSGMWSQDPPPRLQRKVATDLAPEVVPEQIISKDQVYACFKNVLFGEQFHTVQQVRIWADHADGDIQVQKTNNNDHDRIRKLDGCLHMFGAVSSRLAPEIEEEGAFLPTSLDDFTLHTEEIPDKFTCRYYLPLEITRNGRLLTVSFDVLSEAGELLVSCRRYSVAFVPMGTVIPEQKIVSDPDSWLRNGWTAQKLTPSSRPAHTYGSLVYVGEPSSAGTMGSIAANADTTIFVNLSTDSNLPVPAVVDQQKNLDMSTLSQLPSLVNGKELLVVLDMTKANANPGSMEFSRLYLVLLQFLQFLLVSKVNIGNLMTLTSWAAPVDLVSAQLNPFGKTQSPTTSLIGAVVQGMVRVFRRECGLDARAWCLDIGQLGPQLLQMINEEIQARYRKTFNDTFVSFRRDPTNQTISRLVPILSRIEQNKTRPITGTAVITGMGSIGCALATGLVNAGCSKVVFFGRRAESDPEIVEEIGALPLKTRSHCVYKQVDASSLPSVKAALTDIDSTFGGVKHIIHTAAVVNDAMISATTASSFESVLRPKIQGSWNLHVASQELGLALDSFALCSSTNVLVGNPGQIAYVSANSFMDSLAAHRHNVGLPGTSLQLGAWESKLIKKIDMKESFAHLMTNKEGIPQILKAMMIPIPLQTIARMNVDKLAATPAYASDPFFAHLLKGSSASSAPKTPAKASVKQDISQVILSSLRSALELQSNEKLDLAEPLTSCGADSITFAQFKGKIMQELDVDVPMLYLSETYTINDMVNYILEKSQSSSQKAIPANSMPVTPARRTNTVGTSDVKAAVVRMLREALDLQSSENLELGEPLTSCGGDSITFAQFKGQVLKQFEVDVPMAYLSDTYTIEDMITHILESYGASQVPAPPNNTPFFTPAKGPASQSRGNITKIVTDSLRAALDLRPNETLETAEPLTSSGGDSITFAQFKGQIMTELNVDIPSIYLSDSYTIGDMINYIIENAQVESAPQAVTPAPSRVQPRASKAALRDNVVKMLRGALDLRPNERLEIDEALTAAGGDSITFAQFKGQVLKEYGFDIPSLYLSDSFTIADMINHIIEGVN